MPLSTGFRANPQPNDPQGGLLRALKQPNSTAWLQVFPLFPLPPTSNAEIHCTQSLLGGRFSCMISFLSLVAHIVHVTCVFNDNLIMCHAAEFCCLIFSISFSSLPIKSVVPVVLFLDVVMSGSQAKGCGRMPRSKR